MENTAAVLRKISSPFLLCALLAIIGSAAARAEDLPQSIRILRHGGPLDITIRADNGDDISLYLERAYTTQALGKMLTTDQIDTLNLLRAEAPEKFAIIETLFPQQTAEFLLRTTVPAPLPAENSSSPLMLQISGNRDAEPVAGSFTKAEKPAASVNSDFGSREKMSTFLALQNQYSPYRQPGFALAGDTLVIGGKVVTDRLNEVASAARVSAEQYAYERYNALCRALMRWREGQVTGNAYAGTIHAFLRDRRLASFTPEEVSRAYQRVFGRDLKIDIEADREAEKAGHRLTYNELENRQH